MKTALSLLRAPRSLLLGLLLCLPALAGPGFFMNQQGVVATGIVPPEPIEFSPDSISDLIIWLDADDVSGADGDTVETIPAVSPTTISATQSTSASRATKQTGEINGHAALLHDGINDYYLLSSSVTSADSWTAFVVQRRASAGVKMMTLNHRVGTAKAYIAYAFSDGKMYAASDNASGQVSHSSSDWNYYTQQSTGSAVTLRINGSSASLTSFTDAPTHGSFTDIGTRGLVEYASGYWTLILLYNRALTAGEISQVETWIDERYFP